LSEIPSQAFTVSFGNALKSARKAAKMSQQTLANLLGVTQGMISGIEVGRWGVQQSPDLAGRIEKALGLPSGELTQHLSVDHPARKMSAVEIAVVGVVGAGTARDEPFPEERLAVSVELAGCVAYKVRGESMEDLHIRDGGYVFVQPVGDRMPVEGDVVVAWLASERGHVVKRLGKRATLESPKWKYRLADDDVILGIYAGTIAGRRRA
jgi:repressor LexA